MTDIDYTAAVENAFAREESPLEIALRNFGLDQNGRETIEADKPTTPDWGGIPVPVVKEPEAEKKNEAGGKERPFVIPEVEDREKGEGGIFGNAAQAAVNGVIDGVNNTLEAAYQAARFWDDRFGGRVLPQELPDIPRPFDVPDTTVNGVISSVAQFVVPFSVAGKAMRAAKFGSNVAASFPRAMKAVRPMIQGAIADFSAFDAHEKRLSNLIQSVPVLRNPVTEYLSAEDTDGQLEGRFKNAVEGLGLGALTDAFVKGVKAVRAARIAKAKAKAEGLKDVEKMFTPKIDKEDLSALGDIEKGLIFKKEIKPIAVIKTEEAKKILEDEAGETLQEKAISFLRRYENKPLPNQSLGANITIQNGAIKKYRRFSEKEEKQVLAAYIPDLLQKADFTKITEPPYDKIKERNIKAYHKADCVVPFDGKQKHIHLTVKEDGAGNYFWDAQIDEAPYQTFAGKRSGGGQGASGQSTSKNNIAKTAESVNSDDVYINFARIDTPDDIKKVMGELAQKDAAGVNQARRGKMTFAEIKLNAEQEDAFKVLTERRVGEPLNAEQSFAARQLWAASAAKLQELSRLALENPSEANQFMLRKQMATHYAIQKEIIAARTETARALAQWKIPAGAPEEMYQAMKAVLEDAGGDEVTRKMAADIISMNEKGLVKELDKAIEGGFWSKLIDTWNESRIAGLLTNTTTHIVNFTSNLMNVGVAMTDDVFTAGTAKMFGGETSAAATDALLRFQGVIEGMKDGLRCAWKTIRTGASENVFATKFDTPPVIRSETYGLDKDGFFGKSVDMIGKVIRFPFAALEASDDFAKAVHGRGALYVNAAQKARNEIFDGVLTKDGFKKRVAELVENPDAALLDAARKDAAYLTFTGDPSETTKHLGQLARINPLVRFFMPFTKTPGNVFDFAAQHSVFAPISSKFRADISAGGARAQRAIGQMATGTAISMIGMDLALNGLITGGGPAGAERQALMRTGWQPYSVKIGNTYYSYQRFEPIATDLSLMADMAEYLTATRYDDNDIGENDDPDVPTMAAIMALKVGNAVLNKTYMSGMMDIVSALAEPTEGRGRKIAANALMSFVPFANSSLAFSGAVARTTDPFSKDARTTMDAIRANVPGLSDKVPDRLDLFGRKIARATGDFAYDMFVPVRKSPESQDPIDREMLEQGAFVPMPARKISLRGGSVDLKYKPELYNEYVALAGNELKMIGGMGCKDYLNAVVTGKIDVGYQTLNEGGFDVKGSKAEFIRSVVSAYRNAAMGEMFARHPEFFIELQESAMRKVPQ